MASPLNFANGSVLNVRDILKTRVKRYAFAPNDQARLIEKVIVAAADDPDLVTGPCLEEALFRLLHEIASEEAAHRPHSSTTSDQAWML